MSKTPSAKANIPRSLQGCPKSPATRDVKTEAGSHLTLLRMSDITDADRPSAGEHGGG